MEEENVGKALEDSMNRLKRNTDIWDAICDVVQDVPVRKDGRKSNPFKEQSFHTEMVTYNDPLKICWIYSI